jgi:predicted XRE-type DNA-binding protein
MESDGVEMAMVKADAGDSPHMRIRAQLMDAVCEAIQRRGLRQREAAELFGVAQPRVSDLVRGKVALFSIDTLVGMLDAAGVTVELQLHSSGGSTRATGRRPRRSASGSGHMARSK